MILVDANLLIYAVDSDAPHHARARRWLEDVLSSGEPVGLAWMVLLAFLRVTTRDGILVRPLHSTAALASTRFDRPSTRTRYSPTRN